MLWFHSADGTVVGNRMPSPCTHESEQPNGQDRPAWRSPIVGESPAIQQIVDLVERIAARRTTVLISGETGCGKEVIAKAIHEASPRSARQFVAVNCAAIPKDLLEMELFGYVPGAFAGATAARLGQFECAEGGTLFLDEIGDMALDVQAKLLRLLQEREFQRVGSSEYVKLDVRVLAATNVDLLARVKQSRFREDLYYRLHVVPLRVPPLRDRKSDIPLLVTHFIRKIAHREGLGLKIPTTEAFALLNSYNWPGNVRQLENAIEMAMVISGDRMELEPADFQLPQEPNDTPIEMTDDQLVKLPDGGLDFEAVIGRIEISLLEQALERTNGNKKLAADMLRLKRTTLAAKLRALGYAPQNESEWDAPQMRSNNP
ncbi:MAG TPA: sigma-54 dependent transcriptional regulator [Bryobacteraceae bacterium]|nr:sigma-54 dependent transcriptional regulator [Bryobacteraceae bacterium]